MYLYIELFKAKPAWRALGAERRADYMRRIAPSLQQALAEPGVDLIAVGRADAAGTHDAGYDFYSVWRLPSREHVRMLERGMERDGWFDYFEQANASGELGDLETALGQLVRG